MAVCTLHNSYLCAQDSCVRERTTNNPLPEVEPAGQPEVEGVQPLAEPIVPHVPEVVQPSVPEVGTLTSPDGISIPPIVG